MSYSDNFPEADPPEIDPYEVLQLETSATEAQVKSAYRKAALKTHPDKVPGSQKGEANTKFQRVAFAYAILSDPARRKRYDETGSTSECIANEDGFNWTDFYREQFRNSVTDDAIKSFEGQYKGSDEEKEDLLTAYQRFEGDMNKVYTTVMLSNPIEDDDRFRAIIDEALLKDEVESFKKYTNETAKSKGKRKKNAQRDGKEAEAYAKKIGVHDRLFGGGKASGKASSSEDSLAALIRGRQQSRGTDFLANLAAKYGANEPKHGAKKGKKRAAREVEEEEEEEDEEDEEEETGEPSEEAFQAAAARLKKSSKKSAEPSLAKTTTRRSKRART